MVNISEHNITKITQCSPVLLDSKTYVSRIIIRSEFEGKRTDIEISLYSESKLNLKINKST